ncbi:hypothetical protein B0H11DRAFT_1661852, partial [Mycena galericulata]
PLHLPVAIFVREPCGIDRAITEAFARYTKGKANIILSGRNRKGPESTVGLFHKPPAQQGWKPEFVACDASLMK